MSPEQAVVPSPPVASWRPALTIAWPVLTEQAMSSSSVPSASRVMCAASALSR